MKTEMGKRERLVEAALSLADSQGHARTTLADIARESGVPLGNVYYYFKTRDEIALAMIEERRAGFEAFRMGAEDLPSPKARLVAFVNMTVAKAEDIAGNGCPTGSLSAELLKAGGVVAEKVRCLLREPMVWMEEQFDEMGQGEDAAALALQLLSSLQGACLLAQNAGSPDLLRGEGARLKMWINGL